MADVTVIDNRDWPPEVSSEVLAFQRQTERIMRGLPPITDRDPGDETDSE